VCGKSYRLPDGLGGKSFRCKGCNTKLRVPADDTAAESAHEPIEPSHEAAQAVHPAQVDRSLIGGQNTIAGNPGLLKFSLVQFLKCKPVLIAYAVVVSIAVGGFVFFKVQSIPIAAGAVVVSAVILLLSLVENQRKKFRGGNLCAAIVVSTDPHRIALLTDLATGGGGSKLAIGVCRQPLAHMYPAPPKKGTRLVAVCHYVGRVGSGAWDDVLPTVINCGCTDQKQLDRAKASIAPQDYAILERLLPKLKTNTNGLYKLWDMPELMREV
jgi:hypothetical protein